MSNPSLTPDPSQVATSQETRIDLLGGQRRPGPPVRQAFLQEFGGGRQPGPMHRFVNDGRYLALQLYLLHHSLPLARPWDMYLPAAVIGRALDRTNRGAEATISRNLRYLRDLKLIRTKRDRRLTRAFLLDESGSGAEYRRSRRYFILPLAYFLNGWHARLSLPGTVALLISLDRSRTKLWFELPKERAARWFGISADTIQRGFDELLAHELVEVEHRPVKSARARYGWTLNNFYRLLGDFSGTGVRGTASEDAE